MLRDTSALAAVTSTSTATVVPLRKQAAFLTPPWWENVDPEEQSYKSKTKLIVKLFVTGQFKGKILDRCSNGRHIYTVRKGGTELWLFKDNPRTKIRFCVAKKVNGSFVGNASSLNWTTGTGGKLYEFGAGVNGTKIQQALRDVMPMIPFAMMREQRFDLNRLEVLDRGQDETVQVYPWRHSKEKEPRHFMGSLLFKIGRKNRAKKFTDREEFFLFDIDRGDLEGGVFNPFLSRIAKPCSTVAEAYDSLKPQEVRDAERFLKRPCIRQGEWFFIPVPGEFKASRRKDWNTDKWYNLEATLQSKGNRPHYASQICEEGWVSGVVRHGGAEHPDLKLVGWHKAVPNTAIQSFTIVGGID